MNHDGMDYTDRYDHYLCDSAVRGEPLQEGRMEHGSKALARDRGLGPGRYRNWRDLRCTDAFDARNLGAGRDWRCTGGVYGV